MVVFCLIAAFLTLIFGVLSLSNDTLGAGGIGIACFWAILARIAQADAQHSRVMALTAAATPAPATPVAATATPPAPLDAAPKMSLPPGVRKLTANLPGTGRGFLVEVVGESLHQPALQSLAAAAGKDPVRVLLNPEPENPYDPNAVAVKNFEGDRLGYLPREVAHRYQMILMALRDRGQTGVCDAQLCGGSDDQPMVGLRLDLDSPARVAAAVAE